MFHLLNSIGFAHILPVSLALFSKIAPQADHRDGNRALLSGLLRARTRSSAISAGSIRRCRPPTFWLLHVASAVDRAGRVHRVQGAGQRPHDRRARLRAGDRVTAIRAASRTGPGAREQVPEPDPARLRRARAALHGHRSAVARHRPDRGCDRGDGISRRRLWPAVAGAAGGRAWRLWPVAHGRRRARHGQRPPSLARGRAAGWLGADRRDLSLPRVARRMGPDARPLGRPQSAGL